MILLMAWRNIWRNRNRSLINMAAVFSAVVLAVLTASLQKGVFENLIKNVVSLYTGYVQVHAEGYWEEQLLENSFELNPALDSTLRGIRGVAGLAPRLESFALVSTGEQTHGCLAIGVDPVAEDRVTKLRAKLTRGAFLEAGSGGILMAEGLAARLKLGLGDTAVLLTQGYYGNTAAAEYPVQGLLHFGSPEQNSSVVYLPIAQAQYWLDAANRATAVVLDLEDGDAAAAIAGGLKTLLPGDYEAMSWRDMMPEIVQHIETDTAGMYIFLGVLYLLISFGIFSTLLMMLAERRREFGMLVAIGMHPRRIAWMVLLESVVLTVSGALAGGLFSWPIAWYLHRYPIRFGGEFAEMYERFGFEPVFPTSLHPSVFWIQTVIVLFIALLMAIYPVASVLKLQPVKAMRA